MPKALKSCPKSNKSPNLVTLPTYLNDFWTGWIIDCKGWQTKHHSGIIYLISFPNWPIRGRNFDQKMTHKIICFWNCIHTTDSFFVYQQYGLMGVCRYKWAILLSKMLIVFGLKLCSVWTTNTNGLRSVFFKQRCNKTTNKGEIWCMASNWWPLNQESLVMTTRHVLLSIQ